MKNRIKQVRKDFNNLSQETFGMRLGITKSSVSLIESGKNSPSDQTIKLICSEFHINEIWLRTGLGEPHITLPQNELVSKATALLGQNDPIFEAFIETYINLNKSDREFIYNLGMDLLKNLESKKRE